MSFWSLSILSSTFSHHMKPLISNTVRKNGKMEEFFLIRRPHPPVLTKFLDESFPINNIQYLSQETILVWRPGYEGGEIALHHLTIIALWLSWITTFNIKPRKLIPFSLVLWWADYKRVRYALTSSPWATLRITIICDNFVVDIKAQHDRFI